ncbi:MAG: helix-turn-helix transcriptional regulator [Rickettsiales bacterium]|nr:helix-turn-helix transcriptional regulator [Rickettsiales bacterium]
MELTVSLHQAIQLVGLLPCVFMMVLLVILTDSYQKIVIALVYFLCLCAFFIEPLLPLIGMATYPLPIAIQWLQTAYTAFCFLLVVQFYHSRLPKGREWLICFIPLFLGSMVTHAQFGADDFCLPTEWCFPKESLLMLYHIFIGGGVFLLIMLYLLRGSLNPLSGDLQRRHKYWLIMALTFLNVLLLGIRLLMFTDHISMNEGELAISVLRVSFIYLVMTSLFRVFDQSQPFGVKQALRKQSIDADLIDKIESAMRDKHMYRELGINRESLAQHVGVNEQALSKALNGHFQKSFNEYVNRYRIEEAKERLLNEKTAVTVIAFEVGFNSIASFNRVFRAMVGTSPTEYRQDQKPA